ncbi:MAG: 1-acyl-sn-glycerol-3-phosphate acyltransferase [Bacteroidetes bacterium]|nr:1-acyl-sn-glycerol-3-phosphate acyltransferase [Bacteroidota bacterium]
MKSITLGIYDYFRSHRWAYWLALVLSTSLLAVLSLRVSFEEDISKIFQIDPKTKDFAKVLQNSKAMERLIICVREKDTLKHDQSNQIDYCDSMVSRIHSMDSSLVKKVMTGPDDFSFLDIYRAMLKNLPFFLEDSDYANFDSITSNTNLDRHLAESVKLMATPAGMMIQQGLPYDPEGLSTKMVLRLQKLGQGTSYEIRDGYFFLKGKNALVFFIQPTNPPNESGKNADLLSQLNKHIEALGSKTEFSNIDCFLIGSTVTSVGNATQVRRDTMLTIVVMSIALILLITLVFRKKRTPLLMFSPVVFGILFALACISLIKPGISLIAIGSTSVLLGIAINYPLHILTHRLYDSDIRHVISDMVEPMTIGSVTTIGGFVCLLFVKSELLHDFGLLGSFGLIGAVLFSLIFLPHLIGDQPANARTTIVDRWLGKFGAFQLDANKYIVGAVILMTPVLLYFCKYIEFDTDLMHLNYMSSDLKKNEKFLRSSDTLNSPVYIISSGLNFDEALKSANRIKKSVDSMNLAGIPLRYTGVSDFLPSLQEQEYRIRRWNAYFTPEKKASIRADLEKSAEKYGFTKDAFEGFILQMNTKKSSIDSSDFQMLANSVGREAITISPGITTVVSVVYGKTSDSPKIERIISGLSGNTVMDSKFLATQLTSVINDDFNFIAIFSALLVFFALLLTYGRIELALTAFIPMVVSWIWILGLMGLFHIPFNIVNIILSTFIFGLGDDYCIFTMDGLLNSYKTRSTHMPVIRISILLSGLTTLFGFAVMLIAKHPALQSIGAVSLIGITSVLLTSQVLEPLLFKLFITKPVSRGQAPISMMTFIKSVIAFGFFILGCIFLTILGVLLLVINPFFRKKSQLLFNWMISKVAWAQIYIMGNIKKRIIFEEKPDFNSPCIYVANHQSVIDILAMIMLNPRILLLTNKWVWHSPLFGFVVRLAGYYPIFEGVEPSLEALKEKISQGYSIAIFPEGTRSQDGSIGHFHKGAFFLAHQLKLDIIPVVINGTADAIAKGSFVLRDSTITLKILTRIKYMDPAFGLTYQEVTKKVQSLFRYHIALINEELRNPVNYRRKIIDNYLFKGPVLEWYMKIKMRLEQNYIAFHTLVPMKGTIVDAGCGYGFMTYMLAGLSPDRKILGIDYDSEKISVAFNGFGKPQNLDFKTGNLLDYNWESSDCIIFGDVLHYFEESRRNLVFSRAVQSLNPGGTIIVRDADKRPGNKHLITRISELFSTKLIKFNKTQNEIDFFSSADLIKYATDLKLSSTIVQEKSISSNVLLVFNKPANG